MNDFKPIVSKIIFAFALLLVSLCVNAQNSSGEVVKLPFYVTDGILRNDDGVVNPFLDQVPITEFSFGPLLVTFSNKSLSVDAALWKNNAAIPASIEVQKNSEFTLKNINKNIRIVSVSWERNPTTATLKCDTPENSVQGSSFVTWTAPSDEVQEVTITVTTNIMRISRFVIEYVNLAHEIKKTTVDYKNLDILLNGESEFQSWDGVKSYWGKVDKAKSPGGDVLISCPMIEQTNASTANRYATLTPNGFMVNGQHTLETIKLANPNAKMVALSMEANVGTVLDNDTVRLFVSADPGTLYCVNKSPVVTVDWGYMDGVNELVLTPRNKVGADGGPIWQTLDIYYYEEEDPLEKSEAPVIKGAAKFVDSTVVTMEAPATDTKIYYTTDGSNPDVKVLPNKTVQVNGASIYDVNGLTITETTVFHAVAVTEGKDVSPIVDAKFEKLPASGVPTIIGEERFDTSTKVTITAPEADAKIYYTIDAANPEVTYVNDDWQISSNTLVYSGEFELTDNATVKALSVAPDKGPSAIVEKGFEKVERVSVPDLGLSGDQLFNDNAVVRFPELPEGAKVFYTTDDSVPTFSETDGTPTGTTQVTNQGVIELTESCTLKVVIWGPGKLPSNPVSFKFIKTTAAAAPEITGEHHFIESTTVTLTASDNASIYYTTDGSEPFAAVSGSCQLYTDPLILSATTTVKAIAAKEGLLSSAIVSRTFTRWELTAAPSIVGDRSFIDQTQMSLEGAPGAAVYYTLDGSDPSFTISENGEVTPGQNTHLYSDVITLISGCTVKAAAHVAGSAPSEIVTAVFEKLERSQAPVIAAPEIFFEEAKVIITAASDAKIYYTLDGTDPVANESALYEAPIVLSTPAMIKAFTVEEGKAPSLIVSAQVKQALRTPKPVITLPAEFDSEAEISIEAPDARVFYTLGSDSQPEVKVSEADGSISWTGETTEYLEPISVQATTVVKAVAVGAGKRVSEMTEGVTTHRGQTVAPEISGDNPFISESVVTLTAPITARILYTLDGSIPAWELDADGFAAPKEGSSTLKYDRNTPLKIRERTVIKAIAHEKGKTVSAMVSATFVAADATPAPQISGSTPFAVSSEVTISAENEAKIFYTIDGSEPNVGGTWYIPRLQGSTKEYIEPFTLRDPATVKAIAWERLSSQSAVSEIEFKKFAHSEAPEISGESPFESETEISITAPNGYEVYYTIDGSSPTASLDDNGVITGGPLHYTGPFKIAESTVVKAVAVSPMLLPSEVAEAEFVKLEKAPQPVIAAPELFGDEATVELRCDDDAEIHFTLDGSEPTLHSALYEEAFVVTEPCEVRARAWKEGCQPSDVSVLKMMQMDRSEPVVISGTSPFIRELNVTMSAAPQAKIYYSIDGVAPTVKVVGADKVELSDNAILYESPVKISSETTFIAVALEPSKRVSESAERKFERAGVTSKPVIDGITPFLESTTVTITAAQGAEIYFTLDGSEPTESSTLYKGPFELNYGALVRAIAKLPQQDISEVAEMQFVKEILTDKPTVEAPELFGDEAHVRISGKGTVWYTLDGTDPEAGVSERYEEELVFTEPFTIKAIAQEEGKLPSEVTEHSARQMERTAAVSISGSALFDGSTKVTLEADGAEIWYTLDGTAPSVRIVDAGEPQIGEGALLYSEPFEITSSLTVTAVAIAPGKRASLASQRAFERMDQSSAPSISGITPFESQTLVTISAQSGAKIYFTLDGSRPQQGAASTMLYREPLLLNTTTLVRAIAVEEGKEVSPIAEMLFERMAVSRKPEIEVEEMFGDEADVTITAASGARIFYTTDGSLPDATSAEYTGPFIIAESAVVRAVALENGKSLSVMAEREALQMERTSVPDIDAEEMSDGSFRVAVTAPIDAVVYYSVSEPAQLTLRNREDLVVGASTQLYGQPVRVAPGARFHAVAIKQGFRPSEMMMALMPMREATQAPVIGGDSPFEETTLVSLEAEDGLKIFYTLDGSEPSLTRNSGDEPAASGSSTKEYYVPFEISESLTVKAVAAAAGRAVSEVAVKEFKKNDPSGIDELSSDDEAVKVGQGSITGPSDMKVYDAWGRQCNPKDLRPGVYIVVTGNRRFKIMVKN